MLYCVLSHAETSLTSPMTQHTRFNKQLTKRIGVSVSACGTQQTRQHSYFHMPNEHEIAPGELLASKSLCSTDWNGAFCHTDILCMVRGKTTWCLGRLK